MALPKQHVRPTLQDVAAAAGVSLKTASRVVNSEPHVTSKTQAVVHAAIKRLGYHPNELARSLKGRRSGVIGVVVPFLSHSFVAGCVQAIHEEGRPQRDDRGAGVVRRRLPERREADWRAAAPPCRRTHPDVDRPAEARYQRTRHRSATDCGLRSTFPRSVDRFGTGAEPSGGSGGGKALAAPWIPPDRGGGRKPGAVYHCGASGGLSAGDEGCPAAKQSSWCLQRRGRSQSML